MKRTPKYGYPKTSGRALVEIDGKTIWLGPYGSDERHEAYNGIIAEWLANGRRLPPHLANGAARSGKINDRSIEFTVSQGIAAYWRQAEAYYRKPDGSPTSELSDLRLAFQPLRRLYSSTYAEDFGPRALRVLQQEMIGLDWCRTNINTQINKVRRLFKWAVAQEMVTSSVYQALQTVEPLKKVAVRPGNPSQFARSPRN